MALFTSDVDGCSGGLCAFPIAELWSIEPMKLLPRVSRVRLICPSRKLNEIKRLSRWPREFMLAFMPPSRFTRTVYSSTLLILIGKKMSENENNVIKNVKCEMNGTTKSVSNCTKVSETFTSKHQTLTTGKKE